MRYRVDPSSSDDGDASDNDSDRLRRLSSSLDQEEAASDEPDNASNSSPEVPAKTKQPSHGRLEASPDSDRLLSADELDMELSGDTDNTSSRTKQPKNHKAAGAGAGTDQAVKDPPDEDDDDDDDDDGGIVAVQDDDEGADHAVEEIDGDPPNNIPWKPQNVQSTCEFTHTISEYGQKREAGCKKAEYSATTTDEHGNRWRLIIYTNGNGRASNHHLSLFLQVADADDLPFGWKKCVSYVLTLEHPNGGSSSYAKRNPDKTFKLCPKAIDWGWSQFITSDRIQQEGFVANDSLIVRASVTVKSSSVSIDEEDAELYLKYAVEEGDAKAVKQCLEQGASVNCKFKDDLYTPLHTACSSSSGASKGSIEVLVLLLAEGADANACNKWRETPLLIAANNGHFPACEALLEHGADPSLCSEAGWSALTFAAHKGYDDIVKLLLKKGAPVNTRVTEDNSTPLHKACAGSKDGHLAAVRLLLACQSDVHALNKWRETPLLTAANHGQAGAVQLLLGAGADPCKCTDTGWSPLSIAAYKGHDAVVRLLLEEGAPTEEEDPTLSALLQAATKGLPDTVELLLRNGADHTVTTKKGDTALSILVEQNLIDAAVEMVTQYSASIPRCSRDRKKVQRARLLINLRMKQMDRESKGSASTDEDETDEDDDESVGSHTSQHQEDNLSLTALTKSEKKKRKGNATSSTNAEEKARAAEEALLLELEQEDAQAKKDEAEANSKRAKKRKKKERERQHKMKEEQERRAREELEQKERDRLRKEKEEKIRKEQELQLKEQREREMKEQAEREKALAAKHKEKERERQEREQKQRDKDASSLPVSPSGSDASETRGKSKPVQPTTAVPSKTTGSESNGPTKANAESNGPTRKSGAVGRKVAPLVGNRRWETMMPVPAIAQTCRSSEHGPALPSSAPIPSSGRDPAPSTFLAPRPRSSGLNGATAGFLEVDENPAGADVQTDSFELKSATNSQYAGRSVEHPAITLFRREKVVEMIQRCALALDFGEAPVKRAIYRWVVRAAHEKSPHLDPLIPSWTDVSKLTAYFQRQFITESRRGGAGQTSGMNVEALKEAGSSVAKICHTLAKDVEELRQRIEAQLPPDWEDSALGMTTLESLRNNVKTVAVSWANRSSVELPLVTLAALRDRYFGPSNRFLTAVFVAKVWYETKELLAAETGMDVGLPAATQACLSSEAGVTAEFWSDPFTAYRSNVFWGNFEEVDCFFGGQKPFGKDGIGGENVLACHGGSVLVLPPLDNMIASRYVQRILDVLAAADAASMPVSCALFLHAECFHDLPSGPSPNDLHLMDSRLGAPKREFIQHVEVLSAGQHFYRCDSAPSSSKICSTNSLLVLLQNEFGKSRFSVDSASVARIVDSMSAGLSTRNDPIFTAIGFPGDFSIRESSASPQPVYFDANGQLSPVLQRVVSSGFGAIGGSAIPIPFSPASEPLSRVSRPGRLFDLVDDGEDDQINDADLVSGMLNNLDVGLFQNGNLGSDVDIEAISLMGIAGPPLQPYPGSSRSATGRFG